MVTIIPPQPAYNRLTIPDSGRKAGQFEDFVLNTLFPAGQYTLIERGADVKLKDNTTGMEFYIVCMHRYSLISNSFKFSKDDSRDSRNLKSYFFVLGLGGSPQAPSEIYLANFKDCPYMHLFKRHLRSKIIAANKPVFSAALWKYETLPEVPRKKTA
ncbi:MAG: hypothetical protein KF746_13280 [Chitinophagaceae bacterium]|nr:hypothetical protein [Chitinophagaceae bacterium]